MSILITFIIGAVFGSMTVICIALIVGGDDENKGIDG